MSKRLFTIGSLPFVILEILVSLYVVYIVFRPAPTRPDATWTRIQTDGVVRIGIDPSFPPFEVDDGKGNLSGFDIALAAELAQRWNVRVQYVYTGFDGLYDALVGNQFDMILSALPYNPQKTQDVWFSHSYFDGGPVLVVRTDVSQDIGLYDLAQQPVAVELGTSGDAVGRKWQGRLKLGLREFNTANDALMSIENGQVAAGMIDPISFFDFERSGHLDLKTVGKTLQQELYNIAVRKDSPILLQEINAAVDEMKRDNTLDGLKEKWF